MLFRSRSRYGRFCGGHLFHAPVCVLWSPLWECLFHLRCQIFPWCYGSFVFLCGSLGHFVFLYISVLMHLYYDRAEFCSAIVAPSMVFAMMAAAITITTAFPFSGLIPSDRNHNMFRPSYNTPVRSLFSGSHISHRHE